MSTVSDFRPVNPLPVPQLYRRADFSGLEFETTADLEPVAGLIGQRRALGAIDFGTQIARAGFNIFVVGSSGQTLQDSVKRVISETALSRPRPSDWVYVNNFTDASKPVALELPAGRGFEFRDAVRELIADLKSALRAVFESEDYQARRSAIDSKHQGEQEKAFAGLHEKAAAKSITVLRTPMGFAMAPVENGQIVPPEEFNKWPESKQRDVQGAIQALQVELEQILRRLPQFEKERRNEIRNLNAETTRLTVGQSFEEIKQRFADLPRVIRHLDAARDDLIANVPIFILRDDGQRVVADLIEAQPGDPFERYQANTLITQPRNEPGVPIVEELHPTLANLVGAVEHVSQQGVLITSFMLIKAGALHRANGGFLLLDVRHLLSEPFSWNALKRALRQKEIKIEDVGRFIGLASSGSLDPDPIALDVKVILFGDRMIYYLLAALDPELTELFKVLADFEDDVDRSPASEAIHARLIASIVQREGFRPIERNGVALVTEYAARLADHAGKLTLAVDHLRDLVAEADFQAGRASRKVITREDLQKTIDARTERSARLRDRAQQSILENVALIDTTGRYTGQINGLSVFELGGFRFGRPTRITCRVRPGGGKVVDIEREVELGGPIHSKGVLILSGFLAGRYALDTTMSLFASLVFEQSYSGVEGDSASSAELYALLSALADLPLRQELAVTGSVNQQGAIQAIGGVNEKIEGFFDVCRSRGLTGTQGVLIPQANVQHLMLRADVVDACANGQFAIYPIATIDEGIALLTERPAGERDESGNYRPDTVNRLVEDRLRAFARVRHESIARTTLGFG
jgi:lon-related putative ATP-dependent protease